LQAPANTEGNVLPVPSRKTKIKFVHSSSLREVVAMHSEDRYRLVQKRAFEIYEHRDPRYGTADEDWWKAEREIEREEQLSASERKEMAGRTDFLLDREKATRGRA
jgi:Protein of unknown function (DUF2934)